MTFGQNLQKHRKEKRLSQEALANQLFVTRQSVSQWENDRTMPSVDLLLKLSEIFGTTVDALLGKPETESIPQPISSVNILKEKKDIRSAMRGSLHTAAVITFSVALFFGDDGEGRLVKGEGRWRCQHTVKDLLTGSTPPLIEVGDGTVAPRHRVGEVFQ